MKALLGKWPTEVRAEGDQDPVFSLHLSDLDDDVGVGRVLEEPVRFVGAGA